MQLKKIMRNNYLSSNWFITVLKPTVLFFFFNHIFFDNFVMQKSVPVGNLGV